MLTHDVVQTEDAVLRWSTYHSQYRYKKFCLLSLKTQKYIPTDAFLQT